MSYRQGLLPVHLQAVQQFDAKGRSGVAATQVSREDRHMEAKMILKLGQWMAETGQGGRTDITGIIMTILIIIYIPTLLGIIITYIPASQDIIMTILIMTF